MSAARHVLAAVAVVGIFAAGFLAGRSTVPAKRAEAGAPVVVRTLEERWTGAAIDEYVQRLQLTPAQIEAIRPLMRDAAERMAERRGALRQELFGVVRQMNERIAVELTPEQRPKLAALVREKQERHEAPPRPARSRE